LAHERAPAAQVDRDPFAFVSCHRVVQRLRLEQHLQAAQALAQRG
jgi:hypothetical protein